MKVTQTTNLTTLLGRSVNKDDEKVLLSTVAMCDRYMNDKERMFKLVRQRLPHVCSPNLSERMALRRVLHNVTSYDLVAGGTRIERAERQELQVALIGSRVGLSNKPLSFAVRDAFLIAVSTTHKYAELRSRGVPTEVIHGYLGVR